ncbi:MAG TPA: RNA-guided pseudouridylation complex pseudouridine synthase subunit Cbf5 [archaeon]|nr:RNA-guided pseudouridylation complex pseudouridine synthase subunit Cbf5 [archaeon]
MNDFLVRQKSSTDFKYGKYPASRTVEELLRNGIIILDKPTGPTSHQVDAWVKRILGVPKCSHGGTLDPRVSGVLLIALDNATKLMPILLSSKKEYVALVYLHADMPEHKIRKACSEFLGKIKQLPPKKSAVARRVREREIYSLEILEISGRNILMRVGCEAGTYIRRLADDIGKNLGCGGHLQELRRTRGGIFDESKCVTLQKLMDAFAEWEENGNENPLREIILPLELVANNMRSVVVKDSAVDAVCNGAPLGCGGIVLAQKNILPEDWTAILSLKGEMVAFGRAKMPAEEMIKKKAGLAVKTDKVLLTKGTYPSAWKK